MIQDAAADGLVLAQATRPPRLHLADDLLSRASARATADPWGEGPNPAHPWDPPYLSLPPLRLVAPEGR